MTALSTDAYKTALKLLYNENTALMKQWSLLWQRWKQAIESSLQRLKDLETLGICFLPDVGPLSLEENYPDPLCGLVQTASKGLLQQLPDSEKGKLLGSDFGPRRLMSYVYCDNRAHNHNLTQPIALDASVPVIKEHRKQLENKEKMICHLRRQLTEQKKSLTLRDVRVSVSKKICPMELRKKFETNLVPKMETVINRLWWICSGCADEEHQHDWQLMTSEMAAEADLRWYYRDQPEADPELDWDFKGWWVRNTKSGKEDGKIRFTETKTRDRTRLEIWELRRSSLESLINYWWDKTHTQRRAPRLEHVADLRYQDNHALNFEALLADRNTLEEPRLCFGFHGYGKSDLQKLLQSGLRPEFCNKSAAWKLGVYFSEDFDYSWKFTEENSSNRLFCDCKTTCYGMFLCLVYTPVKFPCSLISHCSEKHRFPVFKNMLVPSICGVSGSVLQNNWSVTQQSQILPIAWLGLSHFS